MSTVLDQMTDYHLREVLLRLQRIIPRIESIEAVARDLDETKEAQRLHMDCAIIAVNLDDAIEILSVPTGRKFQGANHNSQAVKDTYGGQA